MAPSTPSPAGWDTIILLAVFTVLNQVILILRFLVAYKSELGYGSDDTWAVLAFVLLLSNVAVQCWGILRGGTGYPIEELTPDQLRTSLQSDYILTWLNTAMLFCVKLSIICLYRRVFDTKKFRKFTEYFGMLVGAHLLATAFASGLRCLPFESVWTLAVDGTTCDNYGLSYVILTSINVVADICLLVIPVFMIRRSSFSIKSKAELLIIFSFGMVMIIAAVLRVVSYYGPGSAQDTMVKVHIWGFTEAAIGLMCASLPTLRPLPPMIEDLRIRSWYSRKPSNSSNESSTIGRPSCNSIYFVARNRETMDLPSAYIRAGSTSSSEKVMGHKYRVLTHITAEGSDTKGSRRESRVSPEVIEVKHAIDIV